MEDLADKIEYMVMERINGITLSTVWDSLQCPEKEVVCVNLRDIMDALRKVPVGIAGSIDESWKMVCSATWMITRLS
jgi:hypothetical protein